MTRMLARWWERACLPAPPQLSGMCVFWTSSRSISRSWMQESECIGSNGFQKILRCSAKPMIMLSLYFSLSLICLYSFLGLHFTPTLGFIYSVSVKWITHGSTKINQATKLKQPQTKTKQKTPHLKQEANLKNRNLKFSGSIKFSYASICKFTFSTNK